jgi:hypothetical protein
METAIKTRWQTEIPTIRTKWLLQQQLLQLQPQQ